MWMIAHKAPGNKWVLYNWCETEEKARTELEKAANNVNYNGYVWGLFTLVEIAERAPVPVTWTKVKVCDKA